MSPLALRRRVTRSRHSLAAVACVLALGGAIAAHHIETPVEHTSMDMHGVATMVMCLGVLGLALMAVAALPTLRRLLPRRAPRRLLSRILLLGSDGAYPARAGPPRHLRLAVLRR